MIQTAETQQTDSITATLDDDTRQRSPGSSIDTLTPTYVRQLCQDGRAKLSWARNQRKRGFELTFGQHYGTDPVDQSDDKARATEKGKRQPVNLGMQQLRTLLWYLTYSHGDPDIEGKYADLETPASILNAMAEMDFARLKMVDRMQHALIDCILGGLGIIKTGVKSGSSVFSDGTTTLDPGEFFAEPVSLDDFVCDPMARRWQESRFKGFRNRVGRSDCIDLNVYGRDEQERDPSINNPYLATRQEAADILAQALHLRSAGDRAGEVAGVTSLTGQAAASDTDTIEVWELEWTIRGRTYLIVVPADPQTGDPQAQADKFLLIEPIAKPQGSLRILSFLPAVDNLVPASLEQLQRDLASCADAIARKITRAAISAKKGVIYHPSQEDTAINLRKASDNFVLKGDGKKFGQFEISGLLGEVTPAMDFVMTHWNNATGNLQLAAGAGGEGSSDSGTATEYQGNLGRVQGWMQYLTRRMEDFSGEVLHDYVWYALTDPNLEKTIPLEVAPGMKFPLRVTPEVIDAKFEDFNYRIRTTSMRPQDPTLEANSLIQFCAQALPAIMSAVQMGVFKPAAIRILMGKLGIKEAPQIVNDMQLEAMQLAQQQIGPPPVWGGEPGGPGAGMPTSAIAMRQSATAGAPA